MIPNMRPMCDSLIEVRDMCDKYALDMNELRMSASRVVESVGNAIDEAKLLGADRVVFEFETMQQGIGDTRDKLIGLHRNAVQMAGTIATLARDFELVSRKVK